MGSSPNPLHARCHHQPACPGCPRFGREGIAPAALDQLRQLAQRAHAPEPLVVEAAPLGSRHRARLSVRGRPGQVTMGIFEAGSHRLVEIADCPLHHPSIVLVCEQIRRVVEDLGIAPYREGTGSAGPSGLLRTVQLAVARPTARVQVVLVAFAEPSATSLELTRLRDAGSALLRHPRVSGVFLNFQPLPTNTLLGEHFEWLGGETVLCDFSGGAQVFYPPGAFGQANPDLHERAVEAIHGVVGDRPVMEYYAGVGTIGLGLLRRGNPVGFNEVAGGSLDGLALGLEALGEGTRAQVFAGRAEDHRTALRDLGPDAVVVLDPPRKGLAPQLLESLCAAPRHELLYLSCGLSSFLRDTDVLLDAGYRLAQLTAFPYFPFTDHVETLGHFLPQN